MGWITIPQSSRARTGRPPLFRHTGMAARILKISWMTEFLKAETRVLLMDYLLSLREVRIWVNTVFILTSRKTEIARSARGPKLQGLRAEDAKAESYLVQKILVI